MREFERVLFVSLVLSTVLLEVLCCDFFHNLTEPEKTWQCKDSRLVLLVGKFVS